MARPMVNAVFLVGNLGKPGKKMFTKSQKPYAFFSVAISRDWYAGQKGDSITDWIDCVTYAPKTVEIVTDDRAKGRTVMVSGNLQTYESDKNGTKIKRMQVLCKYVNITPPIDNNVPVEVDSTAGHEGPKEEDDDEVPF